MLSDTSLSRLARGRPVLFALYETLLTGGCALFWYAVAGLLYLENAAHDPWDPDDSPARLFFLLACVSALSLPVTWLLRGVPVPWLRRIVDGAIMARAVASVTVCAGVFVYVMAR
ncbi:hypothetical protein [Streptomyces canus]|uniref:hypothetical protein n=1 Tax=Streptomyces canus TaxID=58343 RepID=UPI00339E2CE0